MPNFLENLNELPFAIFGASMALYNDTPVLCGGQKSNGQISRSCFQLHNDSWQEFPRLQKSRYAAQMISFGDLLLITGGGNDLSTEIFDTISCSVRPISYILLTDGSVEKRFAYTDISINNIKNP